MTPEEGSRRLTPPRASREKAALPTFAVHLSDQNRQPRIAVPAPAPRAPRCSVRVTQVPKFMVTCYSRRRRLWASGCGWFLSQERLALPSPRLCASVTLWPVPRGHLVQTSVCGFKMEPKGTGKTPGEGWMVPGRGWVLGF